MCGFAPYLRHDPVERLFRPLALIRRPLGTVSLNLTDLLQHLLDQRPEQEVGALLWWRVFVDTHARCQWGYDPVTTDRVGCAPISLSAHLYDDEAGGPGASRIPRQITNAEQPAARAVEQFLP